MKNTYCVTRVHCDQLTVEERARWTKEYHFINFYIWLNYSLCSTYPRPRWTMPKLATFFFRAFFPAWLYIESCPTRLMKGCVVERAGFSCISFRILYIKSTLRRCFFIHTFLAETRCWDQDVYTLHAIQSIFAYTYCSCYNENSRPVTRKFTNWFLVQERGLSSSRTRRYSLCVEG